MLYTALFLIAVVVFGVGYVLHGRFMSKVYGLDNERRTPSEEFFDGVDYCPAHPAVLVGHHFASIAGAGPIVGPIAAAALFGWLPTYVWCLVGSVFFGGPHDMGSVVASMRHEGKSMGEVVRCWISPRAKTLFLWFTWLALVLVVAVFLELSAKTLAEDPAVAFSGVLYMALAVIFGVAMNRLRCPLWLMTLIMVPLVLYAVWYGNSAQWVQASFQFDVNTWRLILTGYIFFASILPVWLLLQPRDYLASYMLYFALIIGAIGLVFGGSGFEVNLPAFTSFRPKEGEFLWPTLFVLVACGAISGFHSMVASGTTSKQLKRESHAVPVGYGSMLTEGLLAIIALATIMMTGAVAKGGPTTTFGAGFGTFAALLGIDPKVGMSLGLLAINSFLLTSLDTATRLARYQLQELTGMRLDRYTATAVGVALGAQAPAVAAGHGGPSSWFACAQAVGPRRPHAQPFEEQPPPVHGVGLPDMGQHVVYFHLRGAVVQQPAEAVQVHQQPAVAVGEVLLEGAETGAGAAAVPVPVKHDGTRRRRFASRRDVQPVWLERTVHRRRIVDERGRAGSGRRLRFAFAASCGGKDEHGGNRREKAWHALCYGRRHIGAFGGIIVG